MGFEGSGPDIYRKMQIGGQMQDIAGKDVVAVLSPFEKLAFRWKNGTLTRADHQLVDGYDTPWCHAHHLQGKHCGLDHQCTFNFYNVVHPRCMSCWKTVVTPKNFDELMIWWKVQNHGEIDFAAKCGIELRDYTPKFYGAYHYAGSLEEGRWQYEKCHELAKKYLSEETANGVILKRACTEYELQKGPSNTWFLTEEDEKLIDMIDTYVDFPQKQQSQVKSIAHPHVQMKWLLWAHMNNDMSYLSYNNDLPLFPGYVKYHEGEITSIKHDVGILTAAAKNNTPGVQSEEVLKTLTEYTNSNKMKLKDLGPILGYDKDPWIGDVNYNNLYDINPVTVGEDDVLS
jgi:hypothetical protein